MTKKNILIYGAGNNFLFSYCDLIRYYNIIAVADGNPVKTGKKFFDYRICSIEDVKDREYDMLIITPANSIEVRKELIETGIEKSKIFDIQDVLDMIPDAEWNSIEDVTLHDKERISPDIAVVFYGGVGDLLIGREWLWKVMKNYQMDGSCFDIYLARDLAADGRTIFRDIIPNENLFTIDTDAEEFFTGKTYGTIFRFCIIPEVWHRNCQKEKNLNPRFLSYVDRLYRYGEVHYNRGFFTSRDFCKTVRKQLVEQPDVRYHTAYDVFKEFEMSADSRTSMSTSDTEEAYLSETELKGKRYITLNTGLNREYLSKRNTRAWEFENWKCLALRIKDKYPDLLVVQVGVRMREEDDIPADIHMNGITNLEQISILLKHAVLHVDYDGGLVHIRHMAGKRSIVLMGPSAAENHAYPENIYLQAPACAPCEWTTPDWLSACPRGYEIPPCMTSITVDMVMEKIEESVEEV